jgi:hypothetical protein
MVSVANEEAKLEKLEGFESIKNDVNEFRVNILELGNFRTTIDDFLGVSTANSN